MYPLLHQTPTEILARDFAATAHATQMYGDAPYVRHLEDVVGVLKEFHLSDPLVSAGWLHDVLEDTPVQESDLTRIFPSAIVRLVAAVTGVGINRTARVACIYDRLQQTPEAVPLKLADRVANGTRSRAGSPVKYARYVKEYPEFRSRLLPLSASAGTMWARLDGLFLAA